MLPICKICEKHESKYKCPVCELRYCSLDCYKVHKTSHPDPIETQQAAPEQQRPSHLDRPGTRQRTVKPDFTNFENDSELKRLLVRYPSLKPQLQAVYAMTLEPGPEDARTWHKPAYGRGGDLRGSRGGTRGRTQRGRRGRRGHFGGGSERRGRWFDPEGDEGQHGAWTQEKGDKEATRVLHKARNGWNSDEDMAEGVKEFVELCQLRFRNERQTH